MTDETSFAFATRAIHAGQMPDAATGAIVTPLFLTSTYVQTAPGEHKGYVYGRGGNPTRTAYEACLASLENGTRAFAMASGMAAEMLVLQTLRSGDHIVAIADLYGGTYRLFERVLKDVGISVDYVDLSDATALPLTLATVLRPNTRMLWLESPTNPLLRIVDIAAAAHIAHAFPTEGASVLVVVDNTFMSPYLQRPLELGADIVVHSTTKFIAGHSDLIGGAVIVRDAQLADRLAFLSNATGAIQSPFDAWLCLRSLKTLAVRMRAHEENAQRIAEHLQQHPHIARVIYPGLPSHAQHALAREQMHGFGAMIAVEISGDLATARRMLSRVRLFSLAESLGGVESLIEHPAIMTHASIPPDVRAAIGISDTLLRLSVGLEDVADLIADLDQALA